jgi:hypothetical protein
MRVIILFIVLAASSEAFRTSFSNGVRRASTAMRSSVTMRSEQPSGMKLDSDSASALAVMSTLLPCVAHADEAGGVGTFGGSNLSLYFTLALYVLTLPGLFSLVTRSVKTKSSQKVYDIPGPANPSAKPLRQTAAEVMAYFKSMNYEVVAAEEVITFRGVVGRSNSQAFFLTFCTFMGLGSLGLVLQTLSPDVIGGKAYFTTLLSPYAGFFYWKNAQRTDEVKVKIETSDDDQVTSIIAEGGKEDLERFSKTLQLPERGKVYVKGLFDDFEDVSSTSDMPVAVPVVAAAAPAESVPFEAGDDEVEGEEE